MNFLPRVFLRIAAFSLLSLAFCATARPLLQPLTPDQGLSQGSVRDLLLDKDGFLWLATDGGINRFGSTRINHINAEGYRVTELAFNKLLQDSSGRIWAASAHAGIYLFNPDKAVFELFMPMPGSQNAEQAATQHIISFLEYDKDNLLFLVNDALYRLPLDSVTPQRLFSLTEQGVENGWLRTALVVDGDIYIGAFNGVYFFDHQSSKVTLLPHLTPEMVDAETTHEADQQHVKYLQQQLGRIWVGTVEGLYSIAVSEVQQYLQHETRYTPQQHIKQQNIWQMLWQKDQALVATEQGLYKFDPSDNSSSLLVKLTQSDLGLFDDNILDVVADNYGGYWLASRDDGAFYWHPRTAAFSNVSRVADNSNSLSSEKVYTLEMMSDHTLWIGTSNGLNKLDLASGKLTAYLVNHDTKAVWHSGTILRIFPNDDNSLWLQTAVGLRLFDIGKNELSLPKANNDTDSRLLASSVYFTYRYKGQFYFSVDGSFFRYTPGSGEVEPLPELDRALGNLQLGGFLGETATPGQLLLSAADQLWLYDTKQQQVRLVYQNPQYQPELNHQADAIAMDDFGILWVGFIGRGLLGFDQHTLELKHQLDGPDNSYALQRDNEGYIWFSSHKGLYRLEPESLHTEHFTKADGLPTHEYNGAASVRMPDGKLAFGSMRGVTLVNTSALVTENVKPSAVITGISTETGSQLELHGNLNDQHINISYQDLGIELNFSSMNFRDAHKMRYRFWLEGKKNLNYPVQQNSKVVFPQLNPGNYIFNVVAISPINGQESSPARLFLSVSAAPWLSNWALSAYALLLLSGAALLYRNRRRQHIEIRQAHDKVKQSEQRLKQALASVNSGAWEWQANEDKLYASRIFRMLGYSESLNPLSLTQHLKLIHPDDLDNFNSRWQRFLQNPESGFDCTYRLKHKENHWLWFRDLGKATELDEANQVTKVIGTFSNITETRANQEKARLFGEAFQQTRDWVVILDETQRVQAANQSFASAFGNMEQYLDQPRTHHLGISLVRRRFYTKLLHDLAAGDHWQGEEIVITPDGRERPTLINISAIAGEDQRKFFVLVFTDITAQKLAEDELRYLANYDALTGLPNRALLMDRIYHGIDQAKRDKRSLALCFIDLDKFKQINDSLGHDVGDLLLKEVARRLTLTLRESDTVARLGGDEFVVLLEGYKREDNISHVARKMLSVVSEPMQFGSHTVGVSPSIGIAVYPDDAHNSVELLKHADVAMYHAKEAGRNNFQFFTSEMNEKAHMRLARETRLRSALKNKEFVNYYQPIVNSQTRQVVGAEVLLRWHSSDGVISPAEFIPLAEELRLIINMTNVLLEQALSDLQRWHRNGHLVYLSVNLSPQHLEQASLAEFTRQLLRKYDIPANCLRYEVTENGLMRDHQSAIDTMLSLSFLGVQLALDDFGTGYSSLKYLKELPIDGIKIDRSFVQDIGIDSSDETIIEAMLSMANSLGMYCIAEGVETEQQLAFFRERHCYLIQGYLFGRPMPAEQMTEFLQQVL